MKTTGTATVYACLLTFMFLLGPNVSAQFTISGTVTNPSATAVADVEIRIYDVSGNALGIPLTLTNLSGFYQIDGVPADTYELEFRPPTGGNLMRLNIVGVVVAGNTVVNAQLEIGVALSGTVLDNAPVPQGILDVDLNVYDQLTRAKISTPGDNTDGSGFYSVLVPVGTYRLRFRSAIGDPLVPVEIENVVVAGATTVDVTMEFGVFVSGEVTGPLSQPVFDADLDFIDFSTGLVQFTPGDNTDIDGRFEVVLPVGVYDVEVEPVVANRLVSGFAPAVVINNDTTLAFMLSGGLSLSGTVTNSLAAPVANVDIDVKDPTTGIKLNTPSDNTDASGNYEVIVPSGVWDVIFQPTVASMLAPVEFFGVVVSSDKILNAVVPDGIMLSGTITDPLGGGVAGIDIDAKNSVTGVSFPLSGDRTDTNGYFETVLSPGTYHIEIEPPTILKFAAKKLLSQSLFANTNINETLTQGYLLSGTIVDSNGVMVPNVSIDAVVRSTMDTAFTPGHLSDSSGDYQIIVAAEVYDILYTPDLLSGINDTIVLPAVPIAADTIIDVSFLSPSAGCCHGTVGNVDCQGIIDIGDVTAMIRSLFITLDAFCCAEAANMDATGLIDIGDLTILISSLFITLAPFPACP